MFIAIAVMFMTGVDAQTPSPEVAAHVPSNLQPYFVAIYLAGEADEEMTHEVFVGHMGHIRKNFESGALRVAGPFTDGGAIRGIAIIQAPSLQAVEKMTAADPAVIAGAMRVEIHPAMFPALPASTATYP